MILGGFVAVALGFACAVAAWAPADDPPMLPFIQRATAGAAWLLFRLVVRAGDAGPNRYGADPLAREGVAA